MSVALIVNPVSGGRRHGSGRSRIERARAALSGCEEPVTIAASERRRHARELAAAAVARGDRLVMAWGGDGTLNEVASAVAFSSAAVAIVPSGSGNGLARSLGVSPIPERAIAEALAARPITIDAGELGGQLFFSIGGGGVCCSFCAPLR